MRVVLPLPAHEIAIEDVYRDLVLPAPPADRPYLLLNFVLSLDGQSTLGGSPAGLGSAADQRLMRRLRIPADMLLYGAGSVRADNFRPGIPTDLEAERLARGLPPQPRAAVVSATGAIPAESKFFTRVCPLVFTSDGAAEQTSRLLGKRAEVIGCGEGRVDLRAALRLLRQQYGASVVLCEGGPHLAHELISLDLLDEIFVTLAPLLGSDRQALRLLEGPAFPRDTLPRLELISILQAESELFLRYRLQHRAAGSG